MNEDGLRKLDFHKILSFLARETTWEGGRDLALSLRPSSSLDEVADRQEETEQARRLIQAEPGFGAGIPGDPRGLVDKARRGGILDGQELHLLSSAISAFIGARARLQRLEQVPRRIWGFFEGVPVLSALKRRIEECIGEDGTVRDCATQELNRVRRRMPQVAAQVRSSLESLVRGAASAYVREPIVTLRGGRYVIPVKQEHASAVKGLVHDQSASGSTLFVEPLEVVELNNEMKKLALAEKREIEKVLAELSRKVASNASEVLEEMDAMAKLDFALAKARLAERWSCTRPVLCREPMADFRSARHPLLGERAVPIDMRIGRDFHIMVVTGPNTGGKTVCLKTVGLLCAMAQAGLQVPAASAEVGCFDGFFCDIGDEQSIEQSLSTFSSHMSNIIGILGAATRSSLVLLDELGAGTDPMEGAALGRAILDFLAERGVRTIATTHSTELKTYAYSRPGVENASVEFDPVTLRPTYRLAIGAPGRSGAFEIAERLGLDSAIVARARSFIGREDQRLEAVIRDLEEKREGLRRRMEAAAADARESEALRRRLEAAVEEQARFRRDAMKRSAEEGRSLVRRAQAEAAEILAQLRSALAEASTGHADPSETRALAQEAATRLKAIRAEITDVLRAETRNREEGSRAPLPADARAGQAVYVRSLGRHGKLVSLLRGAPAEAVVQVGELKIRTRTDELFLPGLEEAAELEKAPEGAAGNGLVVGKSLELSPELHLRGLPVEDAVLQLDKYLDDAVLAGAPQVRIVHGKGTGALRRAVTEFLASHPNVRAFRPGGHGEGGLGVTVAELKTCRSGDDG